MILIIVIAIILIPLIAAYATARFVYKKVKATTSKNPGTISIVAFIVSFCIYLVALGALFLYTVPFER